MISPGFVGCSVNSPRVLLITWHQLYKAYFSMATLSAEIHSVSSHLGIHFRIQGLPSAL